MTDATDDWTNGDAVRQGRKEPASDASIGVGAQESKSFGADTSTASRQPAPTPAELAQDADALLRKSLETVKAQAEELKRQSGDWAALRSDQAREIIDERPLTVVAAAFGLGLIFGALITR